MSRIEIKTFLEKSKDGKYEEVVEDFLHLSDLDKSDRFVMFTYADALYEMERDVDALKAYANFVISHPHEKATNYALFGIAVSLKNIDLQDEALQILHIINPNHGDVKKEIKDSNEIIKLQFQAREILNKFHKSNPLKQ